ncbi:MAG: hypothetical protein HW421_3487 [Ignavibacteria bacterium]|nr:hypothetical protein [Ignavibacteria bacterium]
MIEEPTISSIREYRKKISEKFDDNPHKLVDYYIEYQKLFANRLVDTTFPKIIIEK